MRTGLDRRTREKTAFLSLIVLVLGLPIVLRLSLLLSKQVHPTLADVRGMLADFGISQLVLLGIWALRLKSRTLVTLVSTAWLLLLLFNYFHTKALNALLSLSYISYVLDPVFLRGSVLSGSHGLILTALGILGVAIGRNLPDHSFWTAKHQRLVALGGAIQLALVGAIGNNPAELPWRQQNVLIWNAWTLAHSLRRSPEARSIRVIPPHLAQDLDGKPRWNRPILRPNVLLILVESLSGAYVPAIAQKHGVSAFPAMTRLHAASSRAIKYASVFAHQRQTNRGEYSVLCGDYPKLRSDEARMTEQALGTATLRCLPSVLRDEGYVTAYLQSAPLAFMLKDKFMQKAGFVEQHGTDYFKTAHQRNAWGVDDRTFFEGATRRILELGRKSSPWFLTLLTVGTHHPYLSFPGCESPNSESDFAAAVHCTDIALSEFLTKLESLSVLDNTLVIVTSDESVGYLEGDNFEMQLSQNWIPLLAFLPGVSGGEVVPDVAVQSDIAVSILDYMNLANRAPHFVGRSLFRDYGRARSAYFANTYLGKVWAFEPEKGGESARLTVCDETRTNCSTFGTSYREPFAPRRKELTTGPLSPSQFDVAITYSTRQIPGSGKTQDLQDLSVQLLNQSTTRVVPNSASDQIIFGGQYLTVLPNTEISLNLDVEVQGAPDTKIALGFSLHGKNSQHIHDPLIPLLAPGDRVRIAGSWLLNEGLSGLEAVMGAKAFGTDAAKLRFRKSELRLRKPSPENLAAARSPIYSLERKRSATPLVFATTTQGLFKFHECVTPVTGSTRFVGKNCGSNFVMFGPAAWAPFGSKFQGKVHVRAIRGSYTVWLEVSAHRGNEPVCRSASMHLQPGQEAVLETNGVTFRELSHVELRLKAESDAGDGELEFWDGQLEMAL